MNDFIYGYFTKPTLEISLKNELIDFNKNASYLFNLAKNTCHSCLNGVDKPCSQELDLICPIEFMTEHNIDRLTTFREYITLDGTKFFIVDCKYSKSKGSITKSLTDVSAVVSVILDSKKINSLELQNQIITNNGFFEAVGFLEKLLTTNN